MIAPSSTHGCQLCHDRDDPRRKPPGRRWRARARAWWLLAPLGCAPAVGWERDTARVCAHDAPAVVCVRAQPDRAVEFEIGGARLVPGECARAPERGGAIGVGWSDASGARSERRIRAPAHRRTELALGADAELQVTTRHACDAGMPPFEPAL